MPRRLFLALALPFCLAPADARAGGTADPAAPVAEIVTFTPSYSRNMCVDSCVRLKVL